MRPRVTSRKGAAHGPRSFALAALLLAGCIIEPPDPGPDPGGGSDGWGSGWGGSGGSTGYGCHSDTACGSGYVCARNGECTIASGVRIIHANWTVKGQPASDATCVSSKSLDITFSTSADSFDMFGFAPVPCNAGRYTIDKMPARYTYVTLARTGDNSGGDSATFDAEGNAMLDLPY
jgi:hypothetical protein